MHKADSAEDTSLGGTRFCDVMFVVVDIMGHHMAEPLESS
jgi:hypothetical protein